MKQIKYLVTAFATVCFAFGLTSCEKEKEVIKEVPVETIVEKTDTVTVEKTDTVILPFVSEKLALPPVSDSEYSWH